MRRTFKWLIRWMLINTLVWAVGQIITRSKTSKDLNAEDVELYSFWNGVEFVLRSSSLRRVKARVLMAGATIDLREARPSEEGLAVDVGTLMAGTAVLVPRDWNVEVVEKTKASEVEIRLADGDDVSADGPKVVIYLGTTFGGALVGHKLPSEDGT
ncbi:MAG: hypothetical protein O7C01_06125 [Actinobacteria bacterium]|nr:hypothetical protein [Actinomycetota bacterium]